MTTPSSAAKQVPVTRVSAEQDGPLDRLRKFLETHGMKGKTGPRAFAEFERELHARLMEFEPFRWGSCVAYYILVRSTSWAVPNKETRMSPTNPHLELKAVAAHVLRYLAREQSRGRLVRLDDLARAIRVRRGDVRRVVTSLHAEGHVDAPRMKLTMSWLALAASMRDLPLREPRVAKSTKQSLVA